MKIPEGQHFQGVQFLALSWCWAAKLSVGDRNIESRGGQGLTGRLGRECPRSLPELRQNPIYASNHRGSLGCSEILLWNFEGFCAPRKLAAVAPCSLRQLARHTSPPRNSLRFPGCRRSWLGVLLPRAFGRAKSGSFGRTCSGYSGREIYTGTLTSEAVLEALGKRQRFGSHYMCIAAH
jgi:hypothetical protein